MTKSPGLNPTELRLLAELGGLLATGSSEEAVLEALSGHIAELMPVDRLSMARVINVQGEMAIAREHGFTVDSRQPGSNVSREGSLASEVFNSGTGILAANPDDQFAARFPLFKSTLDAGVRSVIAVPLLSPETIFGVLQFHSLTPGQYDAHHLSIAEAIGVHLGSALTSIGLREDLNRELKEHSAIAEIVQIVNGASEIEAVYDRFAKAVGELVPTERIVISLIADDGESHYDAFVAGAPIPNYEQNAFHPNQNSPMELMIKIRNAVQIDLDSMVRGEHAPDWISATKRSGMISVIAAPLIQDGTVFGSVQVRSSIERPYTEREITLVGEVAAQISGAIASSRLREQLEWEVAEGEVLARNAVSVSGALGVTEIGDAVVEDLSDLLQFDHIGIGSLDSGGETFRIEYQHPKTARTEKVIGKSFPLAGSAIGIVAKSRSPLAVGTGVPQESTLDLSVFEANLPFQLQAGVTFPLTSNGVMVGSLTVGRKGNDEFTLEESHTIERVTGGISGPVANAVLRRQLSQDANHHRVFAEISRVATGATSIFEIGEVVAQTVPEILRFKFLSICRIDTEAGNYWSEYLHGTPDHPNFKVEQALPLEGSMAGAVLKTRLAIVLDLTDPEALREHAKSTPAIDIGMTSTIGVPLISHGEVTGVLLLGEDDGEIFTEADAIIAERVADQVAGSVANLVLQQELRQQSLQRQALVDLGRVTSEAGDLKSIGNATCDQLRSLMGAEKVNITRVHDDGESFEVVFANWDEPEGGSATYRLEESFAGLTSRTRESLAYGKTNRDELLVRLPLMANAVALGFKRAISAPLIADGIFIGNLMVGDGKDDDYSSDELELVRRVGSQIAGAIASIGLREDLQVLAAEREVLAEIGRVASEAHTFDALGHAILPLINRLVPSPHIELRAISSDQKSYKVIFSQEGDGPWSELNDRDWPLDQSGSGLALLQRVPIAIGPDTDVRGLPSVALSREGGYFAGVHAPLISDDEVVGFLVVDNTEERNYSPEEVNLLGQISQQIAGPMASLVLRQQLERESTDRQALADLGRIASEAGDMSSVGDAACLRLVSLLGADKLNITRVLDDGESFQIVFANFAIPNDGADIFWLDGSFAGLTSQSGQSLSYGKTNRSELLEKLPTMSNAVALGFMRAISAPLIANGNFIGNLMVGG